MCVWGGAQEAGPGPRCLQSSPGQIWPQVCIQGLLGASSPPWATSSVRCAQCGVTLCVERQSGEHRSSAHAVAVPNACVCLPAELYTETGRLRTPMGSRGCAWLSLFGEDITNARFPWAKPSPVSPAEGGSSRLLHLLLERLLQCLRFQLFLMQRLLGGRGGGTGTRSSSRDRCVKRREGWQPSPPTRGRVRAVGVSEGVKQRPWVRAPSSRPPSSASRVRPPARRSS